MMKIFKTLLITALLGPLSAYATIVGDGPGVTAGNGSEKSPYIVNLGVNTQTIIAGVDEPIDNTWAVELAESGTLDITFASQTISILNVAIPDFTVSYDGSTNDSGIFSLDLLPGVYEFSVSGEAGSGFSTTATGGQSIGIGGIYSVTTGFTAGDVSGDPSVVPVPAAAWLMGTGILGLLTVRRRKRG